ncbi:hypothetical protein [Henriciella sp.]|uniref:hypothetical protein n=1 Tax=Henriciella sp. TaxID=1968823 RepID=UPI00260DFA17|nr:hypothetical protein [Henriciella sp.]
MPKLRRRRETARQDTWRKTLLFNGLLFLFAFLGARLIIDAHTPVSFDGDPDFHARAETRRAMDEAFRTIMPEDEKPRAFWARQISTQLAARDFSAARGYLLAAPVMLERDDTRAIMAAAQAEETGTDDERLVRAALLFLPNETRAEYQRAVEPKRLDLDYLKPSPAEESASQAAPTAMDRESSGANRDGMERTVTTGSAIDDYSMPRDPAFSMTGDRTDLVRRAQRWVNGDAVDSMQIRLSAISLMAIRNGQVTNSEHAQAVSVLKAAGRAGRLTPEYRDYISSRIDLAIPPQPAMEAVRSALAQVAPLAQLEEQVLDAFEAVLRPQGLVQLETDLDAIGSIAELTSAPGAITLLESASSPEDVRKLRLISEAGGDRAVALSKQIGPRILRLAKTGVKWSVGLIVRALLLAAILLGLFWAVFAAIKHAGAVRH